MLTDELTKAQTQRGRILLALCFEFYPRAEGERNARGPRLIASFPHACHMPSESCHSDQICKEGTPYFTWLE